MRNIEVPVRFYLPRFKVFIYLSLRPWLKIRPLSLGTSVVEVRDLVHEARRGGEYRARICKVLAFDCGSRG